MKLFHKDDFSCPNNIFDISELAYLTLSWRKKLSTFLQMMNLRHPVTTLLPKNAKREKVSTRKASNHLSSTLCADFQPFSQS